MAVTVEELRATTAEFMWETDLVTYEEVSVPAVSSGQFCLLEQAT